jgi:hypothetical protein
MPDDGYTGLLASMGCVTLNVPGDGTDTVASVAVEIAAVHSWVGDVTFKVVSPAGTVVTLVSLPGSLEAADNGTGGSAESSDLVITSPITFSQLAVADAETMGNTIDGTQAVCEDDTICEFTPNAGAATAGTLASFAGESSVGNWQVCAGDSAAQDPGSIDAVTLSIGEN